jgi:hypothetical protein
MNRRAHYVARAEIDKGQDRGDARGRHHEIAGGVGLAAAGEIADQIIAELGLGGEKIVAADRLAVRIGGAGGIQDGRISIAVGKAGEADKTLSNSLRSTDTGFISRLMRAAAPMRMQILAHYRSIVTEWM